MATRLDRRGELTGFGMRDVVAEMTEPPEPVEDGEPDVYEGESPFDVAYDVVDQVIDARAVRPECRPMSKSAASGEPARNFGAIGCRSVRSTR